MGITHATTATGTDAGTGEIHKAQWNASHVGEAITLLSSTVLGSAAADITVTGISSAYKDLIVVVTARSTTASSKGFDMRLGAGGTIDTGSNYDYLRVYNGTIGSGNSGGAAQAFIDIGSIPGSGSTAGYFGSARVEILDYASTRTKTTTSVCWSTGDDGTLGSTTQGLWRNTSAALDSIRVYATSGNIDTDSRMYIYGRG